MCKVQLLFPGDIWQFNAVDTVLSAEQFLLFTELCRSVTECYSNMQFF